MKPLRVLIVQNAAQRDRATNLARIEALLDGTPAADLIVLPEVFALRGQNMDWRNAAEAIPGSLTDWLGGLAQRRGAWVLGGSLIERASDSLFNTSVLISRAGGIAATYRKIHLFEARLENNQMIREQDLYRHGNSPMLVDIEGWRCGLSICYDLRFPELYRGYAAQGAHLFLIPANFTQRTGRDHWEVLVRARAIENQCFVVAPNQCGANPSSGVASHGHSLAVGPWGEVLAAAHDDETVLSCVLDPEELWRTRQRVPALDHRRL